MTSHPLHKKAVLFLSGLLLFLLCACSPASFTTVIYVTSPQEVAPSPVVETPTPSQDPSPSVAPEPPISPEPSVSPEPVLPPEPAVEPHDFLLPVPEREAVGAEWFADAVFIGDSRTDGLRLYGGIKGADYICYKGLICREFDSKACISSGDTQITALEALTKKEYGKVFVMLGLNEIDLPTEIFVEDYALLIDLVRQTQPNAQLYFQTLIPLNEQKGQEKGLAPYFTNEKVAQFNAEILRLTQEKQVLLLDVGTGLAGEAGELPYDATTDGVHFTRAWYQNWASYIKTHTVDPERLEAAT